MRTLNSCKNNLPYGMMLTSIFRYFGLDLDSEIEVRMCKASDSIDNSSISRLGYTHTARGWVEKDLSALAPMEINTDEEAEMDIPPPSPHHSDSGTPTLSLLYPAGAGSSSAPPY